MNQLFLKKPLGMLMEELKSDNRLRRVLGPVQLSALGVGAIIGTGIFVLVGVAAHDRTGGIAVLRRPPGRGPRLCAASQGQAGRRGALTRLWSRRLERAAT